MNYKSKANEVSTKAAFNKTYFKDLIISYKTNPYAPFLSLALILCLLAISFFAWNSFSSLRTLANLQSNYDTYTEASLALDKVYTARGYPILENYSYVSSQADLALSSQEASPEFEQANIQTEALEPSSDDFTSSMQEGFDSTKSSYYDAGLVSYPEFYPDYNNLESLQTIRKIIVAKNNDLKSGVDNDTKDFTSQISEFLNLGQNYIQKSITGEKLRICLNDYYSNFYELENVYWQEFIWLQYDTDQRQDIYNQITAKITNATAGVNILVECFQDNGLKPLEDTQFVIDKENLELEIENLLIRIDKIYNLDPLPNPCKSETDDSLKTEIDLSQKFFCIGYDYSYSDIPYRPIRLNYAKLANYISNQSDSLEGLGIEILVKSKEIENTYSQLKTKLEK